MKRNIKLIIMALAMVLILSTFVGCEEAINGWADKINETTCQLFGHAIELVGYKSPTCVEAGYTGDAVCTICGYTEQGAVMEELADHTWLIATCVSPKTCFVCELTEGDPIAHTLVDVEGKPNTCEEEGYSDYKECECGYTEGKTVLPASHALSEPDVNGTVSCSGCGYVAVSTSEGLVVAVTAAEDGACITVKAGTYEGVAFTDPSSYSVKDLSIVGEDGVVLKGLTFNNWTPKESSLVLDGLTIKNITFDTNGLLLSTVAMSNVTVEGCSFINDACIYQNDRAEKLTNLTVVDCDFTGDKNGSTTALMLENVENLTVEGCTFTNVDFNVLQVGVLAGTVLFDGNNINGTGDRVFRFVDVDADITISNNTIVSDGDGDGELVKCTNACEITMTGNTWNGASDADTQAAGKFINITIKQ